MSVSLKKILNSLPEDRRSVIENQAGRLILEYKNLQALRKSLGLTQAEVASVQGVNQVNVSNFENRSDMLISTLQSYVDSLGCKLEIFVTTPDNKLVKIENLPVPE